MFRSVDARLVGFVIVIVVVVVAVVPREQQLPQFVLVALAFLLLLLKKLVLSQNGYELLDPLDRPSFRQEKEQERPSEQTYDDHCEVLRVVPG